MFDITYRFIWRTKYIQFFRINLNERNDKFLKLSNKIPPSKPPRISLRELSIPSLLYDRKRNAIEKNSKLKAVDR